MGWVRVVAEPTRMLLYSERNAAETVIARAAGGNMATINGSGGPLLNWKSQKTKDIRVR